MKLQVKFFLERIIHSILRLFFAGKISVYFQNEILKFILNKKVLLKHKDCTFKLSTPNLVCDYRAKTFVRKETETFDWIDKIITGCLSNVKGILIEVNDNFEVQKNVVSDILTQSGLTIRNKSHSKMVESSEEFHRIYNQIWSRL